MLYFSYNITIIFDSLNSTTICLRFCSVVKTKGLFFQANVLFVSLQGREILMKMLEVFVRKFKTIAKQHIPAILEKW